MLRHRAPRRSSSRVTGQTTSGGGAREYDGAFYENQVSGSERSAQVILPLLYAVFQPRSVIDIGCGQGAWLAVAGALGSTELTGIDGPWVDTARLRHPAIRFTAADLGAQIPVSARHDLCVSVEVAEHLLPAQADRFVEALCAASDVVLFSAAVRYQGGTAHVNEQRASYWASKFAARGYECVDLVRGAVWDDARVEWWYRQNVLVFVKRGTAIADRFRAAPRAAPPLDLVHPEAFESKMAYLLPSTIDRGVPRMNATVRAVLAVLGGVIAAGLVIAMVEFVGRGIYPPPAGMDFRDLESMRTYAAHMPTGAMLFVLAAWMSGTYFGGIIAGSIAKSRTMVFAGIVGAVILGAAVYNLMTLPHPTWMLPAAVVGIPLAAWLASRTTASGLARGAASRVE